LSAEIANELLGSGLCRYLVYLNNVASEECSMTTNDLLDQKTAPLTPKSFIYNRRPYSQAGRRGFESPLPLHVFNDFRKIKQLLDTGFSR
jgi:hypothetical protein